jgi:hypothetical protein
LELLLAIRYANGNPNTIHMAVDAVAVSKLSNIADVV